MSRAWMPLYVGDYLADTRRLTTLEHGAYLLLIMEYWQHSGLPDDDGELAQIAGLSTEEWDRVRPKLARLFRPGWSHKRIDTELAKSAEVSSKRSASASKRWSKSNANAYALGVHRAPVSQSQSPLGLAKEESRGLGEGNDASAMQMHSMRNADAYDELDPFAEEIDGL